MRNAELEDLIDAVPYLRNETSKQHRGRVIGDLARSAALGRFVAQPDGRSYIREVPATLDLRFIDDTHTVRFHPLFNEVRDALQRADGYSKLFREVLG